MSKIKSDIVADAAAALRAARDLMNHGGRHWIKGSEKMLVDPETHSPGDLGKLYPHSKRQGYEPAFCSVGAINETNASTEVRNLAAIALAEVIDPDRMKSEREEAKLDYADEDPDNLAYYVEQHLIEQANDVIIGYNDDGYTEWDGVRSAFTKAAGRLADRARKRKEVA